MVHKGILESISSSEWATPVVPVVKGDGSIRLCGDYRCTVNKSVKPYTYPLPTVNEVLSTVAGGKVFQMAIFQKKMEEVFAGVDGVLP
ncbi:hypothetical protein JTE90_002921 [Oedothorax gibbosus]|uniref:Reverse transcriptase n=1 Tax=Oedothorax gibbosus TaxID=931172 RepID=A0AAV6TM32_9ARAC|nr:hypothetical protein JTE90_002921 [Oedothorax gibbosus]